MNNKKQLPIMIKSIESIKNCRSFYDFQRDENSLQEFAKTNIIYGWNGTGKTTISDIFASIEKKDK